MHVDDPAFLESAVELDAVWQGLRVLEALHAVGVEVVSTVLLHPEYRLSQTEEVQEEIVSADRHSCPTRSMSAKPRATRADDSPMPDWPVTKNRNSGSSESERDRACWMNRLYSSRTSAAFSRCAAFCAQRSLNCSNLGVEVDIADLGRAVTHVVGVVGFAHGDVAADAAGGEPPVVRFNGVDDGGQARRLGNRGRGIVGPDPMTGGLIGLNIFKIRERCALGQ
ncbi:hypothetical protein FB451DRAFT_307601 [Mycena latifolia]|nr:hypothetical protein FB451DRAFT_307601 [Mycena latifolia]